MPSAVDSFISALTSLPSNNTLDRFSADDHWDTGNRWAPAAPLWSQASLPPSLFQQVGTTEEGLPAAFDPALLSQMLSSDAGAVNNVQTTTTSTTCALTPMSPMTPVTTNPAQKPGDPDWVGNRAIGAPPLTESIPTARETMYANARKELDGIFGKGQYPEPTNHYEYVKLIAAGMKTMSPEQQASAKWRFEEIGQSLRVNFGLTRTRQEGSVSYGIPLNSYAENSYGTPQHNEQLRMKQEFFDERDRAMGRTK